MIEKYMFSIVLCPKHNLGTKKKTQTVAFSSAAEPQVCLCKTTFVAKEE